MERNNASLCFAFFVLNGQLRKLNVSSHLKCCRLDNPALNGFLSISFFFFPAVQHERGPRNSTLRRQMSLYFKDSSLDAETSPSRPRSMTPPPVQNSTPSSTTVPHTSPQASLPPHHMPFIPMTAGLPFNPFARLPPIFPPLPIGRTDLPKPPPELTAFALSRIQSLTTRPSATLLAPTPKYPHELLAPLLSPHESVHETAARILWMNVRWAKSIPAFTALPVHDQVSKLIPILIYTKY